MSINSNTKPEGLSPAGELAYEAIMAVLTQEDSLFTGGCKTFYSPAEWRERGEEYGGNSELVVVYDGGDVRRFFSYTSDDYEAMGKVDLALDNLNMYAEDCTSWYSAVYLVRG